MKYTEKDIYNGMIIQILSIWKISNINHEKGTLDLIGGDNNLLACPDTIKNALHHLNSGLWEVIDCDKPILKEPQYQIY
jgi:hypothetical protein